MHNLNIGKIFKNLEIKKEPDRRLMRFKRIIQYV